MLKSAGALLSFTYSFRGPKAGRKQAFPHVYARFSPLTARFGLLTGGLSRAAPSSCGGDPQLDDCS